MPDISKLDRKKAPIADDIESSDSSSSEDQDPGPLVVPEACLACGKQQVTHFTIPCRHLCLCRACAMKMATGGKCKVLLNIPSPLLSLRADNFEDMSENVCRIEAVTSDHHSIISRH